jgi:hypothetical protein
MSSPIEQLKDRVLNKKGKSSRTELTDILDMVREFQCLGEIIGRDFEVRNAKGELIYTIRQKPIAIKQLNTLLKEASILKNEDAERENAKWGGKGKGGRLNKK